MRNNHHNDHTQLCELFYVDSTNPYTVYDPKNEVRLIIPLILELDWKIKQSYLIGQCWYCP